MAPLEEPITLALGDGSTIKVRRLALSDLEALRPWVKECRVKDWLETAKGLMESGEISSDDRMEVVASISAKPVTSQDISSAFSSLGGQVHLLYLAAKDYEPKLTEKSLKARMGESAWSVAGQYLKESGFDDRVGPEEDGESISNPPTTG